MVPTVSAKAACCDGSMASKKCSGSITHMISKMPMEKQEKELATRIFRTLLLAGNIQGQWMPDGVPQVEIGEIRLKNLLAVLAANGHTQADFAREMDTNAAYVSQIINRHGGRRMGSALARRIEKAYSLPRGWMDNDHDNTADTGMHRSLSDTAHAIDLTKLPEPMRAHLRALYNHLSGQTKTKPRKKR